MPEPDVNENEIRVNIEYCGMCDYGGRCLTLAKTIKGNTPTAKVTCKKGRRGSFEVTVNESLIYSKLQTMALPDFEEVVNVVSNVADGGEIRQIKGEQPINCSIS